MARPTSEIVFETLRDWIAEGVLRPGEHIKDSEVAIRLGCSRTPVREALKRLEHFGVIEVKPGHHTRIAPADPDQYALVIPAYAMLNGLAAQSAAARMRKEDLMRLERHNAEMAAAMDRGDNVATWRADRAFHEVVLSRNDNPFVAAAIVPLDLHAARLDALYFDEPSDRMGLAQHTAIIGALRDGDGDRAQALMQENILRSLQDRRSEVAAR